MNFNLRNLNNTMVDTALDVIDILSKHGEAYIVGGAVRDIIMGNVIHDVDISTNVSMNLIESEFKSHDIGKNKDFGIVVITHKSFIFEISNFRKDGVYSDSRRPDSVQLGVSFKEDTNRRDFTVNSIGVDKYGFIIDYHNGLEDIKNKVLRTVGKAEDRFEEDALRIIRAVRFASRFGYKIDKETELAIRNKRQLLENISRERIKDELVKTISYGSDKFARSLEYFRDLNLWHYIFGRDVASDVKLHMDNVSRVQKIKVIEWGKSLISDSLIHSIRISNSTNVVEIYAMLLSEHDIHVSLDKTNIESLKLTNDEKVSIEFILKNLENYSNFKNLDKKQAFSLYDNKNFDSLRKVFTSLNFGVDVDNIETYIRYISKFALIKQKQKDVNQIILNKGVSGRKFGLLVEKINDWMYIELDKNDILPNDNDIISFIESSIECRI